jgi:hypothetical protein
MSAISQVSSVPVHTVSQTPSPPPPREAQNEGPHDTGRPDAVAGPQTGRTLDVTA